MPPPRVAFGDAGGDRSGIALQTELDPLLRKVARKRLIRSAALRRRDRLALRVLEHHTETALHDGIRTDIAWGPMFTAQPGLLPMARAGACGVAAGRGVERRSRGWYDRGWRIEPCRNPFKSRYSNPPRSSRQHSHKNRRRKLRLTLDRRC